MAKVIYGAIASLDGYVADDNGSFDWAAPDETVLHFINDIERPIGIYLYGRRLYDVMAVWETLDAFPDPTPAEREFAAIWQAADKIVYSRALPTVSTSRTRIERTFDPGAIRELKGMADRDLSVGGPDLAAQALRAGLVDEFYLLIAPIIIGGGKRALPNDLRISLDLLDERRFANGMVYLRYRTRA